MEAVIRSVRKSDTHVLAQICFDAFGALQDRHRIARDFEAVEVAQMFLGMFIEREDVAGFVAVEGGEILGSNFIMFADPVAGVGPITVRPDVQSRGIGRLLMQAVIDEARRRDWARVRLMQEAVNTTSLSLYTRLGFDWKCAVAIMQPQPAAQDDPEIRALAATDLPAVDEISTAQFGTSRRNDVGKILQYQFPAFALIRNGTLVGYFIPGYLGHGFAASNSDMARLIAHAMRHTPAGMNRVLLPLSQGNLHRKLMADGARTLKLMNYMAIGPYETPSGAWLPSIGM